MDTFIELPKVDLHRHVDGSEASDRLVKKALAYNVKLPTYDKEEFSRINRICVDDVTQSPMEIGDLLKRFAWTIAVMRTPEGIRSTFYDQTLDLAKENILYAELRFAPGYHSIYPAPYYKPEEYEGIRYNPMSLDEVMVNAIAGIEWGMKDTGIEVNLTACIPREAIATHGLQSAWDIANLATRYEHKGVVSLDLACDEFTYAPDPYYLIFQSTIKSTLKRNPHAGEMGPDDDYKLRNIETCIIDLCADGLGHAIPLWKDKNLVEMVKSMGIRIERNPYPGDENYGFGELLDAGILISIMSDDPVLMNQSLSQCYKIATKQNNWGDEQINKVIANGVNSAFYRDERQEKKVKEMFRKRGITL